MGLSPSCKLIEAQSNHKISVSRKQSQKQLTKSTSPGCHFQGEVLFVADGDGMALPAC
jgi:hypothetical protein